MQKTLFTFPTSIGLKHRVAAKWFRRYWRSLFKHEESYLGWLKAMENVGVGCVVSACKGLNEKVESMEPLYFHVRGGRVLLDVEFHLSGGNCSAYNCGIGSPFSYDQVVKNVNKTLLSSKAKEWGWDVLYSPEVLSINSDGTYSVDQDAASRLEKKKRKG